MSSSRTTGSSGCLAWRTKATQLCLPRTWFDSLIAVRSENDSSTIAIEQHEDRQPRHLERVRVGELVDALVEREDAADREQDDRDDEGVDETLAPVAERMHLVGLALRLTSAESSSAWLPESASECTPSASIELEPEKNQAMNLVTAMPRFARRAAMIALVPPL